MDFTAIVGSLQSRNDLTEAEMSNAIKQLLAGSVSQDLMVDFLAALYQKGETTAELSGAAQALRAAMIPIRSNNRPVLDTCGTGGDGTKTFNISTAAAIVLSACGCRVAKHGNRKITSSTGSADVLSELGINLDAPPSTVERCLAEVGMCFCFAPHFHPAMKHVGPARKQLSHPTIFNRLGPLANPAGAEHQLIGVGDASLQEKMAETLQRLGTLRSLVVRGEDGVDELSLSAPTRVLEVDRTKITEHRWSPEDFGLIPADRSLLFADDPASSAQCIRDVLSGQPGPCRDVVVMNAAAALWLTRGPDTNLTDCARDAAKAIDSGRASEIVTRLGQLTQAV
jgi:anthranilate phosphoribosyltransferase